jgi:hypothetical protein
MCTYYNFILNLDSFDIKNCFDKFWIIENQSEVILQRLAKNKNIKVLLKEALSKQYNKEISKIYLKYFTD